MAKRTWLAGPARLLADCRGESGWEGAVLGLVIVAVIGAAAYFYGPQLVAMAGSLRYYF